METILFTHFSIQYLLCIFHQNSCSETLTQCTNLSSRTSSSVSMIYALLSLEVKLFFLVRQIYVFISTLMSIIMTMSWSGTLFLYARNYIRHCHHISNENRRDRGNISLVRTGSLKMKLLVSPNLIKVSLSPVKWTRVNDSPAPTVSGGPLRGNYSFLQFHLHWLSEHAIDGMK